MAHFYGTLSGSRGEASRLGTKASGLETVAASWQGAIKVELSAQGGDNGYDHAHVTMQPHHGKGECHTLYSGPVGRLYPDDGWFVELVDSDGSRIWSDVIGGPDVGNRELIDSAVSFASCELDSATIAAGTFHFHPVGPLSFSHVADLAELEG